MASEWEFETVALGEVASVRSGFAFKSTDWTESGIPVVKIANVKDGRLIMDGCSFVTSDVAASAAEFALKVGDILIAMTGYIGDVALVRSSDLPAVLNQRVGIFAINNSRTLDRRFLFYLLRAKDIRSEIEGLGYGSAQPNVSPTLIHGVSVPLPPLPEQRAIAHILGTLDDKIDLNRRMNETLEAMARAIFKSWFVDFDPVRAKAAGKKPAGMSDEIAVLFPDRFQDSEMGEIPKGWKVEPIDQIAEFRNGLALQKFPPTGVNDLPVIKIAELHKGTTAGSDLANYGIPPEYVVMDGDVLFSWSGSLEVVIWCGGKGALNQHLFKVTSRRYPKWFYYHWTLQHLPSFRDIAADKATTMGHIQRHHLSQALVTVPPQDVLNQMDRCLAPIIEKVIANRIESRTPTIIRDSLLPKLISGEIRSKRRSL